MRDKTVLVLGAGASHNYGYPVGSKLRERIIGLKKQAEANANDMLVPITQLLHFIDEFQHSQMYSIDAFLARRMELAGVGKAAIAKVLLQCEHTETLFDEAKDDHWYQYLLNVLVDDDWDSFDPSWLSVVTFNYDRSLECFLHKALKHVYDVSEAEVRERLKLLQIRHVYGDLGGLWDETDSFPYAQQKNLGGRIQTASSRLRVIPEGRDEGPHLDECRRLLMMASRICFLGFGFDETNLRRIGAPAVFLHPSGVQAKLISATARGLTDPELRRAVRNVVGVKAFNPNVLAGFRPMTCLQLLRETLILG